ncbi:MAG: alpha/beta hydrolase [Planctomycetaceae bacterium]|nr:alpha/beta hydrolase [Planctomycetaceae bacterium]
MSGTLPGTKDEKIAPNSPETTSPPADSTPNRTVDETSAGSAATPATAPSPPRSPLDGCPVPISWQVVLREFREQAPLQSIPHPTGPIEYRAWGNGPPIYLLNGMGGTLDHFALVTHLLRDQFRCVIPEYPSVSQLGGRCFSLTLDDLSNRAVALADHLEDQQFNLFATSLGSLVSWNLMSRFPNRVIKAVIAGGFSHRVLSPAERFLVRLGRFLPIHVHSLPLAKLVHQATHRPWFPPTDPTRWNYFSDIAGSVPVRDLAWRGKLIRDNDLTNLLPGINMPVLLIQGEGDGRISNKCRDVLHANLPHSQVEMMANTGHLPHITHPHRLGKSIRNFFLPPEVAK